MTAKVIKVGIMPEDAFRKRMVDIAAGRVVPKRGEPKIWFHSLKSATEILSDSNRELLKMIVEEKPQSYQELAEMSGRKPSNLSRTLKTLEQYGIIDIKQVNHTKRPMAKAWNFDFQARIPC
jgi:predicted transcriptional regulator